MQTDYHIDKTDWDKGLIALCQIGKFEGAAMVLRDLGIVLDGYKSGATLQFRGNIFGHYITEWTGKCRYAFDHTTKNTVRKEVQASISGGHMAEEDLEAANDLQAIELRDAEQDTDDEPMVLMNPKRNPANSALRKRKQAPSDLVQGEENEASPPTIAGPKRRKKLLLPPTPPSKEAGAAEEDSRATDSEVEFLEIRRRLQTLP